jgi:hypothetical protein
LGQLAEIRFGVKSGADDFFFVRDVTEDEIIKCSAGLAVAAVYDRQAATPHPTAPAVTLSPGERGRGEGVGRYSPQVAKRFREKWGISIRDTERVRVVEAGDGSRHLIEAEYLEPEVHSLMEIDSVEIDPAKLSRKILLVSEPPEKLKGTHVLKYIKWGEREGFDQGTTCASRAKSRPWYDLNVGKAGDMAWPMSQKYRHVIALNTAHVLLNHNLFDIFAEKVPATLLAGVLNSSFVALSKLQFGRSNLGEATLKTEVIDVKGMIVPDARKATKETDTRIVSALNDFKKRSSPHLIEELSLPDRGELDDAVLQLLGITETREREILISEMYAELTRFYREGRELDLRAQANRRTTARRDRASPHTIAEEIWKEFDKAQLRGFPADFIPKAEATETVALPAGKPRVLEALLEGQLQVNGTLIDLGSKARAEFAARAVELGHYGETQIPKADRACERALERYRHYEAQMDTKFKELAEERSADPEIQSRIVRELWKPLHAVTRAMHEKEGH